MALWTVKFNVADKYLMQCFNAEPHNVNSYLHEIFNHSHGYNKILSDESKIKKAPQYIKAAVKTFWGLLTKDFVCKQYL